MLDKEKIKIGNLWYPEQKKAEFFGDIGSGEAEFIFVSTLSGVRF